MAAALERSEVEQLVRQVLRQRLAAGKASANRGGGPNPLVVNVSARHAHVTQADLETLFGRGTKLTKLKDLYQAGEFASEQQITVVGPRQRIIPNVRILGPTRNYTQVELSYTDGIYLGIDLPLRISGDHAGTPASRCSAPRVRSHSSGVIRAKRHVHMSTEDMAYYGVRDGDEMKLVVTGPCGTTFHGVTVRYHPKVILEVHIDTDEGNTCDLESATKIELVK
jgi:propanediol utilization protein